MTDAELEAELIALVAAQGELEAAHSRLHLTPADFTHFAAHLARLKAHRERIRAFQATLRHRSDT